MRMIDAELLEPDADYDDGEAWAVSMTQIENAPTIEPKKGTWYERYSHEDGERRYGRMSEAEKRRKDRQELHDMLRLIEPAKNEDIARRAISIADYWLIKSENQAKHIRDLEARNSKQSTIEPKKGRWRRSLVDCGFNADWHCSLCGWKTSLEEHGYNYCPNCGASMREGDTE